MFRLSNVSVVLLVCLKLRSHQRTSTLQGHTQIRSIQGDTTAAYKRRAVQTKYCRLPLLSSSITCNIPDVLACYCLSLG